jgi:hypothetical protein
LPLHLGRNWVSATVVNGRRPEDSTPVLPNFDTT